MAMLIGISLYYVYSKTSIYNIESKIVDSNQEQYTYTPTGDELIDTIAEFIKQDKRIIKVIENKESYPEEILEMLGRNIDMLDYVLEFNEKKGKVYAEDIGELEKGKFPLLLQYDKRWGYGMYGDNVIAVNGCGPTVLSMVIAGLTEKKEITPYTIAKYAERKGYYQEGSGTSWELMTTGIQNYGVKGNTLPLSKSVMSQELNNGHPIVCSMRKGDFTTTGHFILITGIKENKFIVNDPNSKERSKVLWDYETIAPQIKNLWAFELV